MNNQTNINLKRAYVKNVPIRHGEITIVTSDSALDTMVHSAKLASKIRSVGVPTLLINCGMSDQRFKEHFVNNHDVTLQKPEVILKSSVIGNLIGDKEAIDQIVCEANIGVIILAGWEWASSSWRRKQRLLFYLRELMETYNVAVIVYSHCHNSPVPGKVDKGGLGKLSLLAMFVVELETSEQLEEIIRKPVPHVTPTWEEEQVAERSAQLLMNKVKELGGENGKEERELQMQAAG